MTLGYHRVDLVGEPGDFAVRGGVFDLWPAGEDDPVRLDLFGDEIESVRRFEVESQRSDETLGALRVLPLALFSHVATSCGVVGLDSSTLVPACPLAPELLQSSVL